MATIKTKTDIKKELLVYALMFVIGGVIYNLAEWIFGFFKPGNMNVLVGLIMGGFSFAAVALISRFVKNIFLKILCGGAAITLIELACGMIVNVWLDMALWDYNGIWLSLYGQICPRWSLIWCAATIPVIIIARVVRYIVYGKCPEESR